MKKQYTTRKSTAAAKAVTRARKAARTMKYNAGRMAVAR